MSHSFLVPTTVAESLSKRLGRLATQCGVSFDIASGETLTYRRTYQTRQGAMGSYQVFAVDTSQAVQCARFTIGEMPCVNGFTFLGKLVHTPAGNLISLAPSEQGVETPLEWRTAKPTCDHCHTRRARQETFIIRTPDGAIKRVGRNCLRDFLATDPAAFLAATAFDDVLRQVSDGWDDDFGGFGGCRYVATTAHFIACATQTTRKDGFLKRGSERQCTADRAMFLSGRKPTEGRDRSGYSAAEDWTDNQPTLEDIDRAAAAIQWAKDSAESSDYAHNLRVAVASEIVFDKARGILASLPQAYNRAMGQVAEHAAKAAAPDAGHLGTVGERIDATVTVERVKAYETLYGVKRCIAMRADTGHTLITFTTGQGCSSQDIGKRFAIRGTVKRHGDYQGKAQTELSRVKFTEV